MSESQGRLSASDLLGRRTLIVGDVGSGKTRLTAELLKGLLERVDPCHITVVDMAPERMGVGLALTRYLSLPEGVRYLRQEGLRAPRLEGRNRDEVLQLARHNARLIKPLLDLYRTRPTPVLVVNDLSIYLQSGPLEDVVSCLNLSRTFLGNAYYGSKLEEDAGSGLSVRERRLVEELMRLVDVVVRLGSRCSNSRLALR